MPIYPTRTVDFGDGVTVEGIYNTSTHDDNKILGGYEQEDTITLLFRAKDMPENPRSLIGQTVYIDGVEWRVVKITDGKAAIGIQFIDPNKL